MTKKKSGRPAGKMAIISRVDELLVEVVNHFGGQTAAANAIGCSQAHIWRYLGKQNKQSLPDFLALQIEAATEGSFSCEELNPELADMLAVIAENRANKNLAALGAAKNKGE